MTAPVLDEDPTRCMKCGFCMSVCPVYREDLLEGHVARGRNMLIKAVANGQATPDDGYWEALSYCMLCKRCTSVCPAKLSPEKITLTAKNRIIETTGLPPMRRMVNRALLNHRSTLARIVGTAALLPTIAANRKLPLRHLVDTAKIFSGSVSLPLLSSPPLKKRIGAITHPSNRQAVKGKVAIFPGCVFEFFQAHIGEAMVTALAEAGYVVAYQSEDLGCCGQAVHSAGDFDTARILAKKNIDALDAFDIVITGCATCGSGLRAYGQWFEKGDDQREKADVFSRKVMDFSEFMAEQNQQPEKKTGRTADVLTVTYHDPCHLKQHQGVFEAPRKVLSSLPGVRYIEMENADACCGLGGTFGIAHRDISSAILEKKINAIVKTKADAAVTSCPGCLMYLAHGIRRHQLPVKVLHIAELMG